MSECGYRSPQFSEDAAWLPLWLQPAPCDCRDAEPSNSSVSSEDATNIEDFASEREKNNNQVNQLFGESAEYKGFRLHLSGDDDTPNRCTSETKLHFHLHLSTDSILETKLRPLDEVHQSRKNDKKLLQFGEHLREKPAIQCELRGPQHGEAGNIVQDASTVGCTPSVPHEIIVNRIDQKNMRSCHGNMDDDKLREAELDGAIELCISASEALTISDIVSDSHIDSLTAATILNIVLRVKEMRNTCYSGIEAGSASADEVDELDQLPDLDENIMEDAYNDVGFAVTQRVESHNNVYRVRDSSQGTSSSVSKQLFLQSISLGDTNTHVSETLSQHDGQAAKVIFEDQHSGASYRKYDCNSTEARMFSSDAQITGRLCAPVLTIQPDLRDQSITQRQTSKADEIRMVSEKHRGILLNGDLSSKGKSFIRKSMKGLLNGETSYISESEDTMDDVEQIQELKPEIISSSSVPINGSMSVYEGKESAWNGAVSLHDLKHSSNLLSMDPICSFVPCSIVSDEAHKFDNAFVRSENKSVIFKCKQKYEEMIAPYADRSKHIHDLASKDLENSRISSVFETENDEIMVLNDKCQKVVVNIKKRRYQACHEAVSIDDRGAKRYSTSGILKNINSSDEQIHFLNANCVNQNYDLQHGINRRSKELSSLYTSETRKEICKNGKTRGRNKMIFYGLEFLLTGFSSQKEKELEALISQNGGLVLPNIPTSKPNLTMWKIEAAIRKLPIILSPKKVKTTKFLYGCAINTWTLKASWVFDSVQSGSILPPWKYMTRPIQLNPKQPLRTEDLLGVASHLLIFKQLGAMLHGRVSFNGKFFKIVKHGGGQVYKSLQQLVQSLKVKKSTLGVVLVENEADISRHLKQCVSEYNLQIAPVSWIVKSLFSGKLLPLKKDRVAPFHRIKVPMLPVDMSQEI